MADYVYLQGSDDVARAGNSMRQAADDIVRASNNLDNTLFQFRQFMDDWMSRFEASIDRSLAPSPLDSGRGAKDSNREPVTEQEKP